MAFGDYGINWSDPNALVSGAGTGLGILGSVYGAFQQQGYYDQLRNAALQQQRAAMARQDQAINWMREREGQLQAKAGQPLDIAAYQSPMQQAQIAAVRRQAMAQLAGNLPPDLSERMFTTEILPRMIQDQYMQSAGLANTQRSNELAALGWMPGAQAQANNPMPLSQNSLYAMGQYPRIGGMGDVSAFGNYLKGQQVRQDQLAAQQTAARQQDRLWEYINQGGRGPVNTSNLGTDPHRDRIGTQEYAEFPSSSYAEY